MTSSTPPFHSSSLPSSPSLVPPFHSLGNGTVEQEQVMRNTQWNTAGTSSLKALANKVLERNKDRNKFGTEALKFVPLPEITLFHCMEQILAPVMSLSMMLFLMSSKNALLLRSMMDNKLHNKPIVSLIWMFL